MDMCTSLYTEQISAFVPRLIWMIDVPRAPQGHHRGESAMPSERVGCDEGPPFRPNSCPRMDPLRGEAPKSEESGLSNRRRP